MHNIYDRLVYKHKNIYFKVDEHTHINLTDSDEVETIAEKFSCYYDSHDPILRDAARGAYQTYRILRRITSFRTWIRHLANYRIVIPESLVMDIFTLVHPDSYWSDAVLNKKHVPQFFGPTGFSPHVLRTGDVGWGHMWECLLDIDSKAKLSLLSMYSTSYGTAIADSQREFHKYGEKVSNTIAFAIENGDDVFQFALNIPNLEAAEAGETVIEHFGPAGQERRRMVRIQKYIDECRGLTNANV